MPRGFVCWITWLAGTSWAGFTLAEAGMFSGLAAVAFGGVAAAVVAWLLAGGGPAPDRASRWLAPLALLLTATLLPVVDTTLFSQDASVHLAAGRWLAEERTLAIPDPTLAPVHPQDRLRLFSGGSITDKRTSLVRIPGGVVIPDFDDTVSYPGFSHLLSVWVAIADELTGAIGPTVLAILFAFTAWWSIGLIAWRDGGAWAGVGAVALLVTSLPEHWFGRFLMPEVLAQALVWGGVAAGRFALDAYGLDDPGRPRASPPGAPSRRAGWTAGFVAGLSLGVASFARLEQFWVFVPALLLVRFFVPPARWVLPPGALGPFVAMGLQSVFHLWWIPTDYGNRIYKSAQNIYLAFVLGMAEVFQNDGYALGFFLNRILPLLTIAIFLLLLWWGRRLERRTPGSLFRPLVGATALAWIIELYARGLPESFPVVHSLAAYVPWPLWGAVLLGLPWLRGLPGLEIALLLVAIDQVVWGRVSPEQIWASRRLVTVVLPVIALLAVRGGRTEGRLGPTGAYAARGLVAVAVLLSALQLRPVFGVPFHSGGRELVAELARSLPPSSTILLVRPLDWLQLGSALWLGEGRHAVVMREEGYPGYDEVLGTYLRSRLDAPLYVVAGAVVGPGEEDPAVDEQLARIPGGLRLEHVASHEWPVRSLEVVENRAPQATVDRRAVLRLYRAHAAP